MNPAIFIITLPLIFLLLSIFSSRIQRDRIKVIERAVNIAAFLSLGVIAISTIGLISFGSASTELIGFNGIGVSFWIDPVTMVMSWMILLIGIVILRYSLKYLNGDLKHGIFIGRLSAAMTGVLAVVLSGNLGILLFSWIFTSYALQNLLQFYEDRTGALIAGRKKFYVARMSELFLLIAVALIYREFGTGEYSAIFGLIDSTSFEGYSANIQIAGLFLALSAIFKAAQLPTHGWLIEVMETPTPVSALLHAGLINSGPFLIIRLAHVFSGSGIGQNLLIIIGGLSALFGSMVYMTQTSVKTSLAYSSIAHMGFSLMICGLGAYPAAMLHLTAHSFYKAHSFLSSGSAIDQMKIQRMNAFLPRRSTFRLIVGGSIGAGVFLSLAYLFGFHLWEQPKLAFISSIIILSISKVLAVTLDSRSDGWTILKMTAFTGIVGSSFLLLEHGSSMIMGNAVPSVESVGFTQGIILSIILAVYGIALFIDVIPSWSASKNFQILKIHLRNGLYINSILDNWTGIWKIKQRSEPSSYYPAPEMKEQLKPAYKSK